MQVTLDVDDAELVALLGRLDDPRTRAAVAAERALLGALEAARQAGADVVTASVFTTQSATAVLEKIRDQVHAATPAPADFLLGPGGERTVWGMGDGSELGVVRTPFGVVGGLLCWENYMPLARAAIYAQHCDIYLAPTWDNSDVWVASMRHIAKEGRCYVVGVNSCIRGSDVPADLPGRDELYADDDWPSRGNSVIVDPFGEIMAGPLVEQTGILYADVDLSVVQKSRRQFDVVGHYDDELVRGSDGWRIRRRATNTPRMLTGGGAPS